MSQMWSNFKKAKKYQQIKFIVWSVLTILLIGFIIGMVVWLTIGYNQAHNETAYLFAPETGVHCNEQYVHSHDFILNYPAKTYGQMYEELGQDGFTWFYITSIPKYLSPYILLPIGAVFLLISSLICLFAFRSIFPPKQKKQKSRKKGNK